MKYEVWRIGRVEATVDTPTMEAAAQLVADTQGLTITRQVGDNHFYSEFGDLLRVEPAEPTPPVAAMSYDPTPERPGNWCIADPVTRAHLGVVAATDRDTAANLWAQRQGHPWARFLRPGVYHVPGSGEVLVFSPQEDVEALQGGEVQP